MLFARYNIRANWPMIKVKGKNIICTSTLALINILLTKQIIWKNCKYYKSKILISSLKIKILKKANK